MKPALVSLLFALIAACDLPTEPPAEKLPRVRDGAGIVISGRVVHATMNSGLQAANVRVVEADVSVATDENGYYQISLPGRFRGRVVPVSVRAIGFKAQNRVVALTRDTVIVDLAINVDALVLSCDMVIR